MRKGTFCFNPDHGKRKNGILAKGEYVKCKECGKEFYLPPSGTRKYCSRKCSEPHTTASLIKRARLYKHPQRLVHPVRICKTCGKEFTVFPYELNMRACDYCSNACQLKSFAWNNETSIERDFREELERRNIEFEAQAKVDRFIADFRIGNIIVECDGTYWHGTDEAKDRDKRKNSTYKKLGYKLFRFTDIQIKGDLISCVDQIELSL